MPGGYGDVGHRRKVGFVWGVAMPRTGLTATRATLDTAGGEFGVVCLGSLCGLDYVHGRRWARHEEESHTKNKIAIVVAANDAMCASLGVGC